jgi:hypothetical protein
MPTFTYEFPAAPAYRIICNPGVALIVKKKNEQLKLKTTNLTFDETADDSGFLFNDDGVGSQLIVEPDDELYLPNVNEYNDTYTLIYEKWDSDDEIFNEEGRFEDVPAIVGNMLIKIGLAVRDVTPFPAGYIQSAGQRKTRKRSRKNRKSRRGGRR